MTQNETIENVADAQKPKVELPKYMVCEHTLEMFNRQVSIFNLNLEELVFEKMHIMFEKLIPANATKDNNKIALQMEKERLLRELDFKAELGITTKPTIADKDAVMRPYLSEFENKLDESKEEVEFYENKLIIINDLIKTRRLELKIETALQEEE